VTRARYGRATALGETLVCAEYRAFQPCPRPAAPKPGTRVRSAGGDSQTGKAITDLVTSRDLDYDAYLLTAAGLRPLT